MEHLEALFKPAIWWQLRWMPTPYVQGYRALASRHRSHPQVALALLMHLKAMRGHLVAWGLGLQAGRLVSDKWSTFAHWVTFPFSQLEMLAFSRAGKVRAEAKARPSRVAKMVTGAVWAGIARALLRLQAWQLIWHLARLYRPCRLGSNKFLSGQRLLPLPCN